MTRGWICVSAILFLAASLGAQNTPAAASGSQDSLQQTVRNVLIDVTVLGKDNVPIRGLTVEKFRVLDNGVPQKISFFEEHNSTAAPTMAAARPAPQEPKGTYTNAADAPSNRPALVLLMDFLNTPTANQIQVRLQILNTLRQIPDGTNVAIFTLNERLRMIQGFSSDVATLKAALDQTVAWQKQSRLTDDPGTDSYFDSMPNPAAAGGVQFAKASIAVGLKGSLVAREQSLRFGQRIGITLDALSNLTTYLSKLPGRKNVIWFSGGFPISTLPTSPAGELHLDAALDATRQMRIVGDLLTQARVAIYPVDVAGLATPSMFGVAQANNETLEQPGMTMGQYRNEAIEDVSVHQAMDRLAAETGGRAFYGTNNFGAALRTISQTGGNYYTIAYVPTGQNFDGRFHQLKIRIDAPHAKAQYRRGYYADDTSAGSTPKLSAPSHISELLQCGTPGDNSVLFRVQLAPAQVQSASTKSVLYNVNWRVDEKTVALTPLPDGTRRGKLELVLMAYDNDCKLLASRDNSANLKLPAPQYQNLVGSGLPFQQEIALPLGMVHLRAFVVDHSNEHAGATEIPLFISRHPPMPATPENTNR